MANRNKEKDRINSKNSYIRHREKRLDYAKKHRETLDKKETSIKKRLARIKFKEADRVTRLIYKEKNKDIIKQKKKLYYQNNRGRFLFWAASRKAGKLKRTPSWVNLKEIEEFYKACPEGYEVDHIIPLNGKNVSGFHILENLQYLTKEENRKKSNKFTSVLGSVD